MTQGEMEAAVCDGISRFEHEYMGRGPKEVQCYLIGDLALHQGRTASSDQVAHRFHGTNTAKTHYTRNNV